MRSSRRTPAPKAASYLDLARAELERRQRRRAALPLLDFIPALTPKWRRPDHLEPLADLFERLEFEEVRALCSVPPRHGKTETILHGIARFLRRHPEKTVAYVSYGAGPSLAKSIIARDYAIAAGVVLRGDQSAAGQWRTPQGGGLLATSIEGQITSYGCDVLVIDDPHKDRESAESELERNRVYNWYDATAKSRVHPGGAIIVNHTRWHFDDLYGRLSKLKKKDGSPLFSDQINLPAICIDPQNDPLGRKLGEALWPAERSLEWLEEHQRDPYNWWSLWQGSPRPRGLGLFRGAQYFEHNPTEYSVALGVDCAYSTKTKADWCVAVVMLRVGHGLDARYYIVELLRKHVDIGQWGLEVEALRRRWHNAPARWYVGGQEEAVDGLLPWSIEVLKATTDKYTRALPFSCAWNGVEADPDNGIVGAAPCVFVKQDQHWTNEFVAELNAFPMGAKDDQVDAAVAAYDLLRSNIAIRAPSNRNAGRWGNRARGY
jgi:hypothetical protein